MVGRGNTLCTFQLYIWSHGYLLCHRRDTVTKAWGYDLEQINIPFFTCGPCTDLRNIQWHLPYSTNMPIPLTFSQKDSLSLSLSLSHTHTHTHIHTHTHTPSASLLIKIRLYNVWFPNFLNRIAFFPSLHSYFLKKIKFGEAMGTPPPPHLCPSLASQAALDSDRNVTPPGHF